MFAALASHSPNPSTISVSSLPGRIKRWARPCHRSSKSASGSISSLTSSSACSSDSDDDTTHSLTNTPRGRSSTESSSSEVTSSSEFVPSSTRSSPMPRSTRPRLTRTDTPAPLSPRSSKVVGVNLRVGGWVGVPLSSLVSSS